ncbi:hypothetical protein PSEUBRA_003866 [Kalmanozyma brasiliensis GHG001]|uniref:uncharacterized protein n=1 Tax=Kalmanozyma brasiliensis (strain GHG001) TaxID=1365824 RepID=UPI001CE9C6B0|nr:uncharacterized protein PSEUBRA_003866 [Kalmanozyma brasiliensis GHG001]KAF6767307.1 hypothetical protein PSEUBRA_003866 [Kalmanozyma brasiliensis GHG001]
MKFSCAAAFFEFGRMQRCRASITIIFTTEALAIINMARELPPLPALRRSTRRTATRSVTPPATVQASVRGGLQPLDGIELASQPIDLGLLGLARRVQAGSPAAMARAIELLPSAEVDAAVPPAALIPAVRPRSPEVESTITERLQDDHRHQTPQEHLVQPAVGKQPSTPLAVLAATALESNTFFQGVLQERARRLGTPASSVGPPRSPVYEPASPPPPGLSPRGGSSMFLGSSPLSSPVASPTTSELERRANAPSPDWTPKSPPLWETPPPEERLVEVVLPGRPMGEIVAHPAKPTEAELVARVGGPPTPPHPGGPRGTTPDFGGGDMASERGGSDFGADHSGSERSREPTPEVGPPPFRVRAQSRSGASAPGSSAKKRAPTQAELMEWTEGWSAAGLLLEVAKKRLPWKLGDAQTQWLHRTVVRRLTEGCMPWPTLSCSHCKALDVPCFMPAFGNALGKKPCVSKDACCHCFLDKVKCKGRTIPKSVRHEYKGDYEHAVLRPGEFAAAQAHLAIPGGRGLGNRRRYDRLEDFTGSLCWARDARELFELEGSVGDQVRNAVSEFHRRQRALRGQFLPYKGMEEGADEEGLGWFVDGRDHMNTVIRNRPEMHEVLKALGYFDDPEEESEGERPKKKAKK